jgi:hypothetical protein
MVGRKSSDDVRAEKSVAKAKREAHFAKIAAYDAKYKADAQARRDKPAETPAAPEAK